MWSNAEKILNVAVDKVFNETLMTVIPMKKGISVNHEATTDDNRDGFDFLASFERGPSRISSEAGLSMDPGGRQYGVTFEAVITVYTDKHSVPIVKGDLISISDEKYKIEEIEDDGGQPKVFYVQKAK